VRRTRVDICCGVGGTGKTTTSAAIALAAAQQGERVVVITIDPARRLADALGLDALDNTPQRVEMPGSGSLHAMMLDRKRTWDALVIRHSRPEQLLENPYYKAVTTRLSGSQEYMAIEKLHELAIAGDWDRVVVDTPPAQHVLDFFQAPDRIRGILDRTMLRALLEPGTGLRAAAARSALGLVERIAGDGVMSDIREFFRLAGELSGGIRERSAAVAALLRSEDCRYWLVSDADAPERNDLIGFLNVLHSEGMTFAGFLVNRVQSVPEGPWPSAESLAATLPTDVVDALLALPDAARLRAFSHREDARSLVKAAGGAPVWLIPELWGGVATTEDLLRLAPHLPPNPPTPL
jgi:anion-transporting  ArsA/GET3 family ATPase